MGLLSFLLGLEQLKDRMIKSSTMSQVLCWTIVPEFFYRFSKIKLRAFIVWHSQFSQYMWYLWILTKAKVMLCLSLPTTKAYVELIGVEKDGRAYLQYIYCKVKPRIQRELSHTIKSRCACVWICMVANLILLCSLKTYLSFELENVCKKTWVILFISFSPFFQADI